MRTLSLIPLLSVIACTSTKEIEDADMKEAGRQVGSSSAAAAQMDESADESTIQANNSAIGAGLQSLVTQHQSLSATGLASAGIPDANAALAAQDGGDTWSWDGSHLVIQATYDASGFVYDYDVDLTFTADGDTWTADGYYRLDYDLGVAGIEYAYTVDATYDAVLLNATGACGGSVSVDWSYALDVGGLDLGLGGVAGDSSGLVIVTYNDDCSVTISGT